MKKFLSAVLTAAVLSLCLILPSFAAQSADFKITLAEQSDKAVTVTFDFVSGTGFSALDFEIKYNNVKLTLNECDYGDGFTAFQKYLSENNSTSISNINDKVNPIKVAMAMLKPFKAVKGGSLVKMSFSKIPGTKLSENDITVSVTNCQTADFKDIAVSVTTDLGSSGSSGGNSTQYPQMTSVDSAVGENNSEIGEAPAESGSASQQGESSVSQTADNSLPQSQTSAQDSPAQSTGSSNIKTAVIIVAAVLCLAGVGTVIVMYFKNKKRKDG